MIRKKLPFMFFAASLVFCNRGSAQLYINSATFLIQPGATVTVQGNVTSNTDIQGTGKVLLAGTAAQTVDMGGFDIPNLAVNNATNVTLLSNLRVNDSLTFGTGDIQIGNFNIILGSQTVIAGPSSTSFVVTNGTGKLIKDSLGTTAFTYPVGDSTTEYNPVTISNSGTVDSIGVIALPHAYSSGPTGTAFTKEVINTSWTISETTTGGSNLTVTASWDSTKQQLSGFNSRKAGISYYITTPSNSIGWDLKNSQTGVPTANGKYYSYTRSGITSLGTFAIGTRPVLTPLLVSPKVFLEGPYNTTTALMTNNLTSLAGFPLTEPYTALGYTQVGSGGGETTTSAVITNTSSPDSEIVDWIFVQLHKSTDSSVICTRSVLLERNGSLVETDGHTPVNMAGDSTGSYYVSIRHRNHLGVRSKSTVALAKTTSTGFDFTGGLTNSYSGAVANPSQALLTGSVYGMYAGNANTDKKVTMVGLGAANNDYTELLTVLAAAAGGAPANTITISNVYSNQDLNMDGKVTMVGLGAANNDYTKLLNSAGSNSTTITQPSF